MTRHPTPIEALAPPQAECERVSARGLETQSCPRTGLLKSATSPKRVRYLQARGRGRIKRARAIVVARRGWVSHQTQALPDHGFLIAHGARAHEVAQSLTNSDPTARLRRVAHPTLSPLRREELHHRKDGASREHVVHGAPDLMREDGERLSLAVFLLEPSQELLALGGVTEKEHGGLGERPL